MSDPYVVAQLQLDAAKAWLEKHRSLGILEAEILAEAFTECNRMNMAMRICLGSFLPFLEKRELVHKAEILNLLRPVGKLLLMGLPEPPAGDEKGN